MGFKVGMPVLKLVTGNGNGNRSANYRKVLQEMGNERFSKSKTLDRTRSTENEYFGFRAGKKCGDAIDEVLSTYRVKVTDKNGVVRERAMRSNQVIGYSAIIKPPAEVTESWDAETCERFRRDSFAVLEDICPELFGGAGALGLHDSEVTDDRHHHNLMMVSEHNDEEGFHLHVAGMPWTPDGRLSGKDVICLPTYHKLNVDYPQRMRELGWDIDDLVVYDVEKGKADSEYKADHIARKKSRKHGLSVNEYAEQEAQRKAEEATQKALEAERLALDALREQQAAERQRAIEEEEAERVKSEREAIEAEQNKRQVDLDLQAQEQSFKQTELDTREAVVARNEEQADADNDALDAREEKLDARESDLVGREKSVASRELELDARERLVSEREVVAEETITGAAGMITEYREGRDKFLDAYESIADVNTTKEGVSVDDVVDAVFNEGLKLTREVDRNRQPETIYNGRKAAGAEVDWLSNAWGKVANFFRTMTISGVKGIDVLKGRVRSALGLPADYHLGEKMAEALREGQESRQHDDEDPFDQVLMGLRGRGMRGKKTSKKKTTQARQRYQNKSKPGKPGQQLGS